MVQHVHHVRAAHAERVVKPGLVEPAALQVHDPAVRLLDHRLLGAEHDGAGRAGLGAGRRLADGDAVRAEGTLVGLAVLLRDAGDVERASLDAIAAADAVLLDEIDDAVGILHDGTGRRARLEAARVGAVHAAILADQELQLAPGLLVFGEPHQRPGLGRQVVRVVINAGILADAIPDVVPFLARHLARLAANAARHVDELRHLRLAAHVGRLVGGGGAPDDVQRGVVCHAPPSPTRPAPQAAWCVPG